MLTAFCLRSNFCVAGDGMDPGKQKLYRVSNPPLQKDSPPATPGGAGHPKRQGKKEKQPPSSSNNTKAPWSALVALRVKRMVTSRGSAGDSSTRGLTSPKMPDSNGSTTWSPPLQNSGFPMLPIYEHSQPQSSTFSALPPNPLPRSSLEDPVSDESRNYTHPRDSGNERPVSGDRPRPTTPACETKHTIRTRPVSSSLTRCAFAPHTCSSLVEAILSSKDEDAMIRSLPLVDAQTFVDVMDEARCIFTLHHRSRGWN